MAKVFMANDVTVRSALWQLSLVKYGAFILVKESNSTATCWGFQCISVAFEHTSISKSICNLLYNILFGKNPELILNLTVWWFGDFPSLLCWWNRLGGEAQRAADEKIKEKEWMWVTTWMISDAVSSGRLQKIGWYHVHGALKRNMKFGLQLVMCRNQSSGTSYILIANNCSHLQDPSTDASVTCFVVLVVRWSDSSFVGETSESLFPKSGSLLVAISPSPRISTPKVGVFAPKVTAFRLLK